VIGRLTLINYHSFLKCSVAGHTMSTSQLSYDQKLELYRNGYIILKGAVQDDLVAAAVDRMDTAEKKVHLGREKVMTDLINRSSLTPILNDVMGEFDPPSLAHVAVIPKTKPSDRFNSLGYRDRDTPYFGAVTHMDGNITMRPPQEIQQESPEEIYRRYIASGPKGDLGRCADVIGHNFVPLFEDKEMTLSLGSFTTFAIVCLSDQTKEGSGQTAVLKGAHFEMERFFRKQYRVNRCVGPEGPDWPRLNYEVANRCGLNYVPPEVNQKFLDENSESTPDGRRWARPTQILMEPGDACLTMYHIPHTASRNERGVDARRNVIFRLRNKKRQPDKVVNGATDHPDRGFLEGEWLDFEEGNNPWERSKKAMCHMWDEWEGMQKIVAQFREKNETISA